MSNVIFKKSETVNYESTPTNSLFEKLFKIRFSTIIFTKTK